MSKRIYIDMDGTLCRFHDTDHDYIEQMWEKGFYLNLKPFEEFLQAVSLCIERNPNTEFYILSAVLETEPPFAADEKREWLHKYLPQLSDEQMIFVSAGSDKSAYIGELDADSILIDDYNKNLNEWRKSGGTAIKFINDINNKGLGAYGGEKGNLWDGAALHYENSAMNTCLQIEQLANINEENRSFYGFKGDVTPEDFFSLMPSYFEKRQSIDNAIIKKLYTSGEAFGDYSTVSLNSKKFVADHLHSSVENLHKEFANNFHITDDAILNCLEKCYELTKANNLQPSIVYGWMVASIKYSNAWQTYPITPSNMTTYFSYQIAREALMKNINNEMILLRSELKHTERKMYMPSKKEVASDLLQQGGQQVVLAENTVRIHERISELKQEWFALAKAEYPNVMHMADVPIPYSRYIKQTTEIPLEK